MWPAEVNVLFLQCQEKITGGGGGGEDAQDDVLVNLTVTDRQSTGGPTNSIESELVVK